MSAEIDHALVPHRGRHDDAMDELRLERHRASSGRVNAVGSERTSVEIPVAFHLDDEAGTVTLTGRAGGHNFAVLAILDPDPDAVWPDSLDQNELLRCELSYEATLYGNEDADEATLADAREAFVDGVEEWNARHGTGYDPHARYF